MLYSGLIICLSFLSPRFGIAHALCLGLAPWLAAEVPILVDSGVIKHKDDEASSAESWGFAFLGQYNDERWASLDF